METPAEESSESEEGEHEDNEVASERHTVNLRALDDVIEDFLPVMDDQTELVDSENVSMEDDMPCDEDPVCSVGDPSKSPVDGERRLSLKRSRSSCFDSTPSVQVTYKCLTRESRDKLKELLQQWAQWHGEFVQLEEDSQRGPLENGDEYFFPPLQVRGVSNSTVSFWMDKASKQVRTEVTVVDSTTGSQDREKEVPLYDRVASGVLISQETEMSLEGGLESIENFSRCFNCGSYSHSLKECTRPRDLAAINSARKLHSEKRGSANSSRSTSRYYQTSPGGKFDDLKPGVLGSEIRQLLGIGERDPPPWLNRMRELGYPPGYLEDQEEEQSGIRIYGTNEDAEGTFIGEDGEIVGEKKNTPQVKKMKVHFPGVNAPIPDDADRHVWGSPLAKGTQDSISRRVGRNAHGSATVADATEDFEGPPGSNRDKHGKKPKNRSPGFGGPLLNKTPPWQPSEAGRPGIAPLPRSPHLSRSASDSGRRSPRVAYDEPHLFPPSFSHHSGSRQRPHQSPLTPNERFPQRHDSREEDSRQRAWAHVHGAFQHMHHNDRYSPGHRR